ncbi:MAG: TatD DNase family protein [Thermotogaceae bacterium]|jgi:TatD DNase family protein|nr:TatD DNase family protein [Thermotogaceae bacterium]
MWIDTHTHLWDEQFDKDRKEILDSLGGKLKYIIEIGVDSKTSQKAVTLAYKNERVFAVVGVHPHDAKHLTEDVFKLVTDLSKMDKVVGIGEIGLDFYKNYSSEEKQRKCFIRFLNYARESNLPVVLHVRDAYEHVLDILNTEGIPKAGGVVHSFLSSYNHAKKFLDLNLFLGIGGPITFKKNSSLRDTLKKIPIEKILLETDCPYLTPVPKRGHRNDPAYVEYVAQEISKTKNIPILDVEEILYENTTTLFGLPKC